MSSNWETLKVQDILYTTDYVANGSFASLKENVKYLNKQDYAILIRLVDFNSSWNGDFVYVDKKSYDFLKKSYVEPKDVIISNVGANVGTVFQAPNLNQPMTLGPNSVLVKPAGDNIDRDFVYYFFTSPIGQSKLNSIVSGSAQPKFNKTDLRNIEFPLPPLPIQKKIAHILSTLDDKIELNRKMNQTLEEMAQTIFKSWFVDFDPVHAKANCESEAELENIAKELGISKAILELFPSEFIESELGMIPKGWEWKSFGDVVIPKRGKTITKSTITEGNIPVVAGGLSPAYYHGEYNAEAPTITISASGANAGYVNLYNQNIWASDCSYINNTNTKYVYSMYLFLKAQQYEITRMQQGVAQPHVYPKDLMRLMIVDCEEKFWELLEKIITPIFEKIAINQNEIQTLEKTRDTLLPKLLSGEIDVSELEI